MLPRNWQRAVARTTVSTRGNRPIHGTGFLITRRLLLTCAHCLGTSFGAGDEILLTFNQWAGSETQRSATLAWRDEAADLAILRLRELPPDDVKPLALSHRELKESDCWNSWAYPVMDGVHLEGTVAAPRIHNDRLAELVCAKARDLLAGASGGPILVEGAVAGVLTEQLTKFDIKTTGGETEASVKEFGLTVYARPVSFLRKELEDICGALTNAEDYCSKIDNFQLARSDFALKLDKTAENIDSSKLFYVLMAIKNETMTATKKGIHNFLKGDAHNYMQSVTLWSLLGSRELLLTFRDPDGRKRAEDLRQWISENYDSLRKMETDDNFVVLDVGKEYAVLDPGKKELEPVDCGACSLPFEDPGKPYNFHHYRSVRAFILLVSSGPGSEHVNFKKLLHEHLHSFRDVVHRVSVTRGRRDVMIELHLPCGKFGKLKELSKELESTIESRYSKMTFLAYDLTTYGF